MNDLRLGVIGCGHLGKIHARLAQQLQHATLVGFSDPNQAAREQVAETVDCPAYEDFTDLLPHIDAAIVAAPTSLHFSIVQQLLEVQAEKEFGRSIRSCSIMCISHMQ